MKASGKIQPRRAEGILARGAHHHPIPCPTSGAFLRSWSGIPVGLGSRLLLLVVSGVSASAQTYSINWSKISTGGGTSTGGVYAVTGTIGQHDAGGAISGGDFSLTGGFWHLFSWQIPGSPTLTIRYPGINTAIVSWQSPSTGFRLQFATDLLLSDWVNSVISPSDEGINHFLIVTPPNGNRFFRLIK